MSKEKWTTATLAPIRSGLAVAICISLFVATAGAAEPHKYALRELVARALQNSRELALARVQQSVAEKAAGLQRAEFHPNLFTGSGAAYTNGFPETPGGRPPAPFSLSYVQTLFNPPLRGQLRAAEERAHIQQLEVERTRDAVILRTVSAFLELAKVRHALELGQRERAGAQKILEITRARAAEGLELSLEVTRAELELARIEERIVRGEGREEALVGELRNLTGVVPEEPLALEREELSLGPEQPIGDLVELAMNNNAELKQAELERRAREHRLKGERGGYWPTIDFVGQYSVFSRINNYDEFFRVFRRHNLNVGVDVRIPIFSARTSAAVGLAESEFRASEIELKRKRAEVDLAVRGQARRARELDAAREVARLELKLAQENLRVVQARFEQGRANLRELERARLEEADKWMAFLDANYNRQRAQLNLLQTTGQLARVFQ